MLIRRLLIDRYNITHFFAFGKRAAALIDIRGDIFRDKIKIFFVFQ
jgi:hypothetical protein